MKPTRFDQIAHGLATGTSRRQILTRLAVAAIGAAGFGTHRRAVSASVCGFDDSQDVALYRGDLGVSKEFVDANQSPVGNLRWNTDLPKRYENPGNVNARRWCSGTLVSDDLFLTAGFCLETRPVAWEVPRIDGTEQPISRTEIATNMHVDFNYQIDPQGNDPEPVSFPVLELVEDQLGDLPYVILRLDGSPGQSFGAARVGTDDPSDGDTLCVIGHPLGLPKRVATGQALGVQDFRLFHDVDTEGGSGGSGLLTSPEGVLVGMHTNGGCDARTLGNNHGVRITALLEVSPNLRELVGG
jgi:hypothetical protein